MQFIIIHVHVAVHNYYTVEPLNKGHIGTSHFALCREVVLSLEVENVLVLWESKYLGPKEVSFIDKLFLICPLFGGFTIGGSTVLKHVHIIICIIDTSINNNLI